MTMVLLVFVVLFLEQLLDCQINTLISIRYKSFHFSHHFFLTEDKSYSNDFIKKIAQNTNIGFLFIEVSERQWLQFNSSHLGARNESIPSGIVQSH